MMGIVGTIAIWTAFLSAIVACGMFLMKKRLGNVFFFLHGMAITAALAILYYLMLTHQYQYYYVWTHTSNELPLAYTLAALWEGQEGSFLLWLFWQTLLSLWLWFRYPKERYALLSVVLSVQVLLTSMLLGWEVNGRILIAILVVVSIFILLRFQSQPLKKDFFAAIAIIAGLLLPAFLWNGWLQPFHYAFLGISVLLLAWVSWRVYQQQWDIVQGFFIVLLWGCATILGYSETTLWKIGSSPFVLLKDAMPDAHIFQKNPDFVPVNGSGLNPLLQSYWMVIHPPTLFLGYALAVVPFAFVVVALWYRYSLGWLRKGLPWLSLAALVLGVGIILGGYWAYETLSFGGYWAWDPVENASLVPWLIEIAAIHAFLSAQRKKNYYPLFALLTLIAFILILYSTFLTRSGVLGDASVHSFTDLGLSGQLLLLLFAYALFSWLLLLSRWRWMAQKEIPWQWNDATTWLLIGVLILWFLSVEILFVTSFPAINKLLGTQWAPPTQNAKFYFQSTVWFTIALLAATVVAVALYWKKQFVKKLFYPFAAAVLTVAAIQLLWYGPEHWFVYEPQYYEQIQSGSWLQKLQGVLWLFSDDLLLLALWFAVYGNGWIAWHLIRQRKWQVSAGTIAHIGFALMLLGAFFSSGFEKTVSKNLHPQRLTHFKGEEKKDNVLLVKNFPVAIQGYKVTYIGMQKPKAPFKNFKVLYSVQGNAKVAFQDARGDYYYVWVPAHLLEEEEQLSENTRNVLKKQKTNVLETLKLFIELNKDQIPIRALNERRRFILLFQNLKDTTQFFYLLPEAEVNEQMGLIVHPDRKVFWDKDLYVHISSLPKDVQKDVLQDTLRLGVGDTLRHLPYTIYLKELVKVQHPDYKDYDWVIKAKLQVWYGAKVYDVAPLLLIKGNEAFQQEDEIPELHWKVAFMGVDTQHNQLVFILRRPNEGALYVVIKAIEKPFINLLWLGTFLLSAGLFLSLWRRFKR